MKQIVTKLLWIGLDQEGKKQVTFRPLDDGSFTASNDDEILLNDIKTIKLAHISLLSDEEVKAWRAHLSDYEVTPTFEQLRDNLPIITDQMRDLDEIDDRKGFLIESFKLQTIANKYGYEGSKPEWGGWFASYQRRFPSANLITKINFTGNSLPQSNITTAITSLSFMHDAGIGYYGIFAIALKDVPPVLLVETLADYYAIAASGTGFDPDWRKKTKF